MTSRGMAGVVLAAGEGTRLRPLTALRPKPLCPVGNRALLDLALDRVAPHVDEVAVNAHHLAEQVLAHVGGRAHVSVETPRRLGTAGALGRLRGWTAGRDVLLHNGDAYLDDDLTALLAGWDGCRPRLLVVATSASSDFGPHRYVGAALLPGDVAARLPAEPCGLYDLVLAPAWDAGELELVEARGVAIDCGTPRSYLAANLSASGGASVVAADAVVDGIVERCVVWPGGRVAAGEHLVEVVRVGDFLTVDCS